MAGIERNQEDNGSRSSLVQMSMVVEIQERYLAPTGKHKKMLPWSNGRIIAFQVIGSG